MNRPSCAQHLHPLSVAFLPRCLFVGVGLIALSCGNYSTQESYGACKGIQEDQELTDAEFSACVACFENCGQSCGQDADAGVTAFTCP